MKCKLNEWVVFSVVLSLWLGCSKDEITGPGDTNQNHCPVISQQSDTSTALGDTLQLVFAASDQDGDTLHFGLKSYCSWSELKNGQCPLATLNPHDGKFSFQPRTYDVPSRRFKVVVDDGRGGIDSTIFDVMVN